MASHRRESNLHGRQSNLHGVGLAQFFTQLIAVGVFAQFRVWAGGGVRGGCLPLGSHSFSFFCAQRGDCAVFLLRSLTFLLTMKLLEVEIVVGLAQFVFNLGSCGLPLG
jgi:hypothetical protein